ncbi:hypothetical protein ABE599_09105 [Achromobacter mucicolens]|uniref:hypothetical protein n=2 Tax=Achromobacter mucicolens TaxID=1389922 RepID=UPI0032085137
MRRALEIRDGAVVAGSVAEMIEKFSDEIDPTHYADQTPHGKSSRRAAYENLIAFFGRMAPRMLRKQHGYQFLQARAEAGAPARANKEISQMATICHFGVRWDLMDENPFTGMMLNKTDKLVRVVTRRQVLRFYLWSLKQRQNFRTLGCAAMFTYLTGFRAAEVRPFLKEGLQRDGVIVISAKRKKGETAALKRRYWSRRLHCVVQRALQREDKIPTKYLFAATRRGACYSRSGWGSSWQDAMNAWIRTIDPSVKELDLVTEHDLYFSLQDIRPTAVTRKLEQQAHDAYDFAGHANPSTTHKHYDRRRVKSATATE